MWRLGLAKVDTPNPIWTLNLSTLGHECSWQETITNKDLEKPRPKTSDIHNIDNVFSLMQTPTANLYSLIPLPHHDFIMNSNSWNPIKKLKLLIYGCIILEHCTPHVVVHDVDMNCWALLILGVYIINKRKESLEFLVKFLCGLSVRRFIRSNESCLNDVQNLATTMVSFKFSLEEFNLQYQPRSQHHNSMYYIVKFYSHCLFSFGWKIVLLLTFHEANLGEC